MPKTEKKEKKEFFGSAQFLAALKKRKKEMDKINKKMKPGS